MIKIMRTLMKKWAVLFSFTLLVISTTMGQVAYSVLGPQVKYAFNMSDSQFGFLTSAFAVGCSFFAIFGGISVDRFGVNRVLLFCTIGMCLTCLLITIAPLYIFFWVLTIFVGIVRGPVKPLGNKIVFDIFPKNRHGIAIGLKESGIPVGIFISGIILPYIAIKFGWQSAYTFIALIVFISGFIAYFTYQNNGKYLKINKLKNENIIEDVTSNNILSQGNKVKYPVNILWRKNIYPLWIYGFTMCAFQLTFITFLVLYLVEEYNMDIFSAASCLSISQIGAAISRPMIGYVSDNFFSGRRKPPLVFSGLVIAIVSVLMGLNIVVNKEVLLFLVFLLGVFSSCWVPIYFTYAIELNDGNNIGTVSGLASFATNTGAFWGPLIFGFISDLINSYHLSWIFLSLLVFTGTLSLSKIKKQCSISSCLRRILYYEKKYSYF